MYIKRLHYKEIDSTHAFAKREEKSLDARDWTAISADNQSQGRGQGANGWQDVAGHAFLCTLLSPEKNWSAEEVMQRHLATAVVVCEHLSPLAEHPLGIKWPNDIYLQGKKLAGILTEALWEGSHCRRYIGSMGVNLTSAPEGCAYLGTELSVETIRAAVLQAWAETLDHGMQDAVDRFNALLIHRGMGRWRRLHSEEVQTLHCLGVDRFGRIGLEDAQGLCHWYHHGEIQWVPERT